jgi:hypothetical protein
MDEAARISYDHGVEELRAKEYPMLQGQLHLQMSKATDAHPE